MRWRLGTRPWRPGWWLSVRIEGTDLHGIQTPWASSDESEQEWLRWRSTGSVFEAYGGPRDLARLVDAFRAFALEHGDGAFRSSLSQMNSPRAARSQRDSEGLGHCRVCGYRPGWLPWGGGGCKRSGRRPCWGWSGAQRVRERRRAEAGRRLRPGGGQRLRPDPDAGAIRIQPSDGGRTAKLATTQSGGPTRLVLEGSTSSSGSIGLVRNTGTK